MATTSGRLAQQLLAGLAALGVPAALLHGDDEIAEGRTDSDLDLIFRPPLRAAIHAVECAAKRINLAPLLFWVYDVNSVTLLFGNVASGGLEGAVQVDVVADPEGLGKYAIRTDIVLSASLPGQSSLTLAKLDEALYLWRKGTAKGQAQRQAEALKTIYQHSEAGARARATHIFADGITPFGRGSFLPRLCRALRRASASVRRLHFRLSVPMGITVEVPSRQVKRLTEGLSTAIPSVVVLESGGSMRVWLAVRRNAVVVLPRKDANGVGSMRLEDVLAGMSHHYNRVRQGFLQTQPD